MKKQLEYIIQFEGLKNGNHRFDFLITDVFFEALGTEIDFNHAQIQVAVDLVKSTTMLVFDFDIQGQALFPCDRCLDEYLQPISSSQKLIVNFGEESQSDYDSIITLSRSEYEINLAPIINDYILIALPMKRECANQISAKSCNPEMIQRIEELSVDPNSPKEPDPRWNALQNKNNLN